MDVPFENRTEAGKKLATKLSRYANRPDVLVLALPRGGVPVAYEVARALSAPLDVFVVRKLGGSHDTLIFRRPLSIRLHSERQKSCGAVNVCTVVTVLRPMCRAAR